MSESNGFFSRILQNITSFSEKRVNFDQVNHVNPLQVRIPPQNSIVKKTMDLGTKILQNPIVSNVLTSMFMIYFSYWLFSRSFGNQKKEEISEVVLHILKKRKFPNGKLELNKYEAIVASGIIVPSDKRTTFEDIGGMKAIKKQVHNDLLIPIRNADKFKGKKLGSVPKGLLLYGPPGTGKTSIAKAIASEGDYIFINLKLSDVYNKYVGESEKVISATFSLARKIQPAIIFIDELDSIFKRRTNQDQHVYQRNILATFMAEWDGMLSEKTNVILIGATNRRDDLDEAILRRLERSIYVGLPSEEEREDILRVILKEEELSLDFSFSQIAEETENWSGSTLRSLCDHVVRNNVARDIDLEEVQPATTQDFLDSIELFAPQVKQQQRSQDNGNINDVLKQYVSLFSNLRVNPQ